jgi:glycosyltransferase involved in cell wall biosynthesis
VAVTGRVDDVREYVAGASVIAIPLRMGSGTRLKAIEAAALGLPIVGTSIGLEGLGFVDGKHALVRDNPAGLASAVLAVLESPDLGIRVGTEAREHVRSRFNWLTCLKPLLHALEQAPVQVKV